MENRICAAQDDSGREESRSQGPQPIGEILEELLTRYQVRFPEVQITVVHTPVAVA